MRSRVTARSTAAVVAGFVALSATAAVAQETIFEQSFSVQDGALLATELVEMDIIVESAHPGRGASRFARSPPTFRGRSGVTTED